MRSSCIVFSPASPSSPSWLPRARGLRASATRATQRPPRQVRPLSQTEQKRRFSALSWHDEVGSLSLSERQEGFLLSKLPSNLTEDDIARILEPEGITKDDILLAKSRLGRSTGRCIVHCAEHIPHVAQRLSRLEWGGAASNTDAFSGAFASTAAHVQPESPAADTSEAAVGYRPLDRHDMRLFVEQAEAFLNFSDDLHYLAQPEHFLSTVTIHNIPRAYGRRDVSNVLREHCAIEVSPHNVIFNMKKFAVQSDMAFVVCESEKQALHVVAKVQELAVPKHAKYETLFGCSFLYADRSCLFWESGAAAGGERIAEFLDDTVSCGEEGDLDFEGRAVGGMMMGAGSSGVRRTSPAAGGANLANCVYTQGWEEHMTEEEFASFLNHLKFFPDRVRKIHSQLPVKERTGGPKCRSAGGGGTGGSGGTLAETTEKFSYKGSAGFLLDFPTMKLTKSCFTRLRRMKKRWQMPENTLLYAYPRPVDVHWSHEKKFRDEIEQDWELTEPVVY